MDIAIKLSPAEAAQMDAALGMAASTMALIHQKEEAASVARLRATLRDRYAEAVSIYLVLCPDEEVVAWGKANNIDMDDVMKSVEIIRKRLSDG